MEGKYINPYTDFGFKKLFGTEMNKELLISFLNSLFEGHEEIRDITYKSKGSIPWGFSLSCFLMMNMLTTACTMR